jgi:hypothetical protein
MGRRLLLTLLALLLLSGGRAFSQEERDPKAELEAAKARLEKLAEPKTEDDKRWKAAIEKRIALLEESIGTAEEYSALLDPSEIERNQKSVTAELSAEQAKPEPETAGLRSLKDLEKFEEARRAAEVERDKASALVKETDGKRDRGQEELKTLPARDADAKRKLADLTGEDDLTTYQKENLELDIGVTAARQQYFARAMKSHADLIALPPRGGRAPGGGGGEGTREGGGGEGGR